MSGYPYKGTAPTRPNYGGTSNIHALPSTSMGNGVNDAIARGQRELVVASTGQRHPNVSFAYTNVNANTLHETPTPSSKSKNLNSNKEDKYTMPTSTAVMFSKSSHDNTIEAGEFKNVGGNMTTGNVGSIPSKTGSKKGEPPIQPTRTTSSTMFDESHNNIIRGGKFVNVGGDLVDNTGHGKGSAK